MALADTVLAVIAFCIGCFYSCMVLFGWLVGFVKAPLTFFSCKRRDEMPACLKDPDLGTHGYIHLEEVRLHYVAEGDEKKPLMLFVHGFPEFWYSWRYQIREFKKDYRVVAIDQRGYADSDKPSGVSNYKVSKMVGDLKQLVPALGYKTCTLVAHDWGGAVAWTFAAQHQDLVDKLIIMNCPHPVTFQKYMRSNFSQFRKSWYMFFFQVPCLPEMTIRTNDFKAIEGMFTKRPMGLVTGKASKDDIEAYKYAFTKPGALTGAINYYRAAIRYPPLRRLNKITCPVLIVWGCQDAALEKQLAEAAHSQVENLTIKYIEEASHWVQIDTPDKVNQYMREFLS